MKMTITENLKTCPTCKGEKKQKIVAQLYQDGKFIPQEPVFIDCMYCDGIGKVSKEIIARNKRINNIWCKCKEDHGAKFYNDGEHDVIYKHHYKM